MDYVYGTLSNHDGENPLDYAALRDNPMEFVIVASNAETGEARYFDKRDIRQDDYDVFKRPRRFRLSVSPISFKVRHITMVRLAIPFR